MRSIYVFILSIVFYLSALLLVFKDFYMEAIMCYVFIELMEINENLQKLTNERK